MNDKPFSEITGHAVIVALQQWNGRMIVATPQNLYEVKDGILHLMKFVQAKDNYEKPF